MAIGQFLWDQRLEDRDIPRLFNTKFHWASEFILYLFAVVPFKEAEYE